MSHYMTEYVVGVSRSRITVAVEKQHELLIFVCVRARVSVGACVHVSLLIQHAKRMRHIVTSSVAPRSPLHFSTLSHKLCDFRKKLLNIKCVFSFSVQLLFKTFPILRII